MVLAPLAAALPAVAALPEPAGDKIIDVPKLAGELRIDGVLDEPQWAAALVVRDLHQYQPYEYSAPSQETVVRVFYTEEALYVSAFFEERDPSLISASVLRQGESLVADDIFSVILDPYLDRRNGYRFTVNPNGVDGLIYGNPIQLWIQLKATGITILVQLAGGLIAAAIWLVAVIVR